MPHSIGKSSELEQCRERERERERQKFHLCVAKYAQALIFLPGTHTTHMPIQIKSNRIKHKVNYFSVDWMPSSYTSASAVDVK